MEPLMRSLSNETSEDEVSSRSAAPGESNATETSGGASAGTEAMREAERRVHARLQSAALALLATGGLLTLMYVAKPVLIVIFTSVLIAFMLAPVVELCQRLRLPRSIGAFIAVLLMCAALYGAVYAFYNQAGQIADRIPKYTANIRRVIDRVRVGAERVRETTQKVIPPEKPEKGTVTVRQSSDWLSNLTSGARGVTEFLVMAAFVPFLVFFMLSWQEHVRSATVLLFAQESRRTAYVTLGLIAQMIRGFIVGNVIIGILLGITSTVAFWILGVPYFYLIGIVSGVVSLLPYLGIVLAILPPVVVSLDSLTTERVVAIVAIVVVSHLIALNVLYPKIIGRRLQLNPLTVTLALLFWGWLWGAMGLILAVPLTGAIKIIFDHIGNLKAWGAWLGE
jgi:predicted PurR-regulated permease PerM